MLSRKIVLIASAPALIVLAAFVGFRIFFSEKEPGNRAPIELSLPALPPLLAMEEGSGEVYRSVKLQPKTGLTESITVGYLDGRKGIYLFQKGKLRSYKGFDSKGELIFEADYELDGSIASYQIFKDKRICTQFRRLPDASEELLFFNQDGYLIKSVVTARDGSQRSSTRKDKDRLPELVEIKAEANELNYGQLKLADGKEQYRLKLKLLGSRLSEWEYRDRQGQLRQTGRFTDNNRIEITLNADSGQPAFKQIWHAVGEDWAGRIYRLAELEKLNSDGSVSSKIILQADGVTPKEIHSYWWGHKNSCEYVDKNGFIYRQEYFDSNGFSNGGYDQPPQYRRKVALPPQLLSEPRDEDGKALYRLKTHPYSQALEADRTNPILILPK